MANVGRTHEMSGDVAPAAAQGSISHHDGEQGFTISIKLMVGETCHRLELSRMCFVGDITAQMFALDIAQGRRVVYVFQGRRLEEGVTLQDYGITNNSIVHCIVSTPPSPSVRDERSYPPLLSASRTVLYFILTVFLGACWGLYLRGGDKYFTPSAVAMLCGLSAAFLFVTLMC